MGNGSTRGVGRLAWVTVAMCALVVGGCAKGESTSTETLPPASVVGSAPTTTITPAKALYLEQAGAICREMKVKGAAAVPPASGLADPAALAPVLEQMSGVVDDAVRRLRALSPPSGDEATVSAAVDALATASDETRKTAVAAKATDERAFMAAYTAQQAAQKSANELMRAYGLADCAFD